MALESSFLSQTLQSITTTKMREQDKRRTTFEKQKASIIDAATAAEDDNARLEVLLSGFKELSSGNKGVGYVDDERAAAVSNVARYLEQSRCDPSVSSDILRTFESKFRQKLDQESARFSFTDLYYRLLAEWTDQRSEPIIRSEKSQDDLDGQFEHVQKYTLQNLREKFSNVVFTPLETDEVEIDLYLNSLFDDDNEAKLIEQVRHGVKTFGDSFIATTNPFDRSVLKSCIQALLTNDLLKDDAKETLAEFATNDVVLDEIADVLNLRFSDLKNWSWDADEGMYYEPRRQANGKYRIMMDQDILQALFLHYIAVRWCANFKVMFNQVPRDPTFWKGADSMTAEEKLRFRYFVNMRRTPSSLENEREDTFLNTFLLSSLPSSLKDGADPYGEDKESDGDDDTKTGLGIRQLLLRQVATDVIIQKALYGEVAVVQSDLQWYATGLPHSTLWAVLRFWGVPDVWIDFFKKFAEAPLRMTATPGEDVRIRKRGIPITDAFEKLFGECVLFLMDVAVNRLSGMTLIRFHDDLWLSGKPSKCAHAWEVIEGFVKTLGLDINTQKTGSIYLSKGEKDPSLENKFPKGPVCMGMLELTEAGDWSIDQKQVSAHIRQLRKQLGQCTSIISWIQTWNACMGKFFQNILGNPANCFGQAHVNAILETFKNMQRELFDSHEGSVTQYLRELISVRLGVDDIPDSFFFLPEDFGGLGLQNPFIPFFLLKDQVLKSPAARIAEFQKEEKQKYKEKRDEYIACTEGEKKRRFRNVFESDSDYASIVSEPFFSFEEYTRHREINSLLLMSTYQHLMRKPHVRDIQQTNEMKPLFRELVHSHSMAWETLSSEHKWIMDLYAGELKQRFGALSIVDRNLLPSGVMKMLRRKKVTWQLIIWD